LKRRRSALPRGRSKDWIKAEHRQHHVVQAREAVLCLTDIKEMFAQMKESHLTRLRSRDGSGGPTQNTLHMPRSVTLIANKQMELRSLPYGVSLPAVVRD
jgi:hypothetical protein